MSQPDEDERAAQLLEKLLTDPAFRASFRMHPAEACQAYELHDLAREFGAGAESGKSLHTLEIRESRSSLAGAFMAAASEGGGGVAHLEKLGSSASGGTPADQGSGGSGAPPVDPDQVGGGSGGGADGLIDSLTAGSGGGGGSGGGAAFLASPDDVAGLLDNSHVTLSPEAYAALARGGADARLVSVLDELSKDHELRIGALQTTQGAGGDSLEILAVDGERVSSSNIAARDLANELSALDPSQRPAMIVTPWPIDGEGFSTDGIDDRIQIVFGTPGGGAPAPDPTVLDQAPPAAAAVPPSVAAVPPPVDPPAAPPAPDPASAPPADPPPDPGAGGDPGPADAAPPPEEAAPPPVEAEVPPPAPVAPPLPVEPPPAPAAPYIPPASLPVEPAPVSHQSIQLGAVGAPVKHSTLQFDIPGSGGDGEQLRSMASAFDPNAPGGLPDTGDAYPGDSASKSEIAAWMGRQAHKAGLPAELPIMAGLTESGLTNVQGGDRDSVGFFQMRTGIWDQGEYAGFQDHPELQLKWFIDHAVAVRSQRIAEGDVSFGSDKSKWGDWVADVERPAEEYRGRYATHLEEADDLLKQAGGAGAGGPAGPGAEHVAAAFDSAAAGGYSTAGMSALMTAEKFTGTAYHWGGSNPDTGFDCSGLVQYSYHQAGIEIPRVTDGQFAVGIPETREQLKPGDPVFFRDDTGYIHHVGLYVGNGMFLHAPHTGDVVKISSLDEPYYAKQFAGGRDYSSLATGAPPPPVPPGAGALPVDGGAPAPPPPADPVPGESGIFAALGDHAHQAADAGVADQADGAGSPAAPKFGSSTVQILPAVKDPNS